MKILVTGGAGFIGSNVVDAYIAAGHEVVVMDNLFTGKWENLNPKARFYLMDVRAAEVRKVFERERFDVVNHHAAQMSVPASVADPDFDADVNVRGFINLLEASRATGVRKVIFISSGGAIYGEADEYPTSEAAPARPLSPYAITKAVSEQYLAFYRHQYGLDFTVLRYANIYGPRQIPHGEAGVVSLFMDRLLAGRPCTIYHYPDEERGMSRDYCFVGDVVQANLLALDKEEANYEVFNVGSGKAVSIKQIAELVIKMYGGKVRPLLTNKFRKGDVRHCFSDISKIREKLGFAPRISMEQGMQELREWSEGIQAEDKFEEAAQELRARKLI